MKLAIVPRSFVGPNETTQTVTVRSRVPNYQSFVF